MRIRYALFVYAISLTQPLTVHVESTASRYITRLNQTFDWTICKGCNMLVCRGTYSPLTGLHTILPILLIQEKLIEVVTAEVDSL
jgi:hypothetical protein